LDHVSIPVSDLERSGVFYDQVLAPLGLVRRRERAGAIAYGPTARNAPIFWLLAGDADRSARPGLGLHLSFEVDDGASVDAFHAAGLAAGGRDAGPPGSRPEYTQPFYGAFILDLDGFKIEAVCRTSAQGDTA
jgi:catechol 2,3-dioxygenase-like lactoylglutathione lyase family enzyme